MVLALLSTQSGVYRLENSSTLTEQYHTVLQVPVMSFTATFSSCRTKFLIVFQYRATRKRIEKNFSIKGDRGNRADVKHATVMLWKRSNFCTDR
jgi:hypothetical protein